MHGAYLTAVELLEELDRRDREAYLICLGALADTQEGQSIRPNNPRAAIYLLERAYRTFANVSAARCLQGACAADLAAAHGQLDEHDRAANYARQAIAMVSGVGRFAGTEGSANMTLGVCLYHSGDIDGARTCFNLARRLFRTLPDGAERIALVDQNEAILEGMDVPPNPAADTERIRPPLGARRRWWQFWKR